MPLSERLLRRILDAGEDPNDWESESDEDAEVENHIIVPQLLSPSNLAKPNDTLCDTCKSLKLTPRRFVVLPSDGEATNKPDDSNIQLGTVSDIKKKSNCPFCRLVLKALFKGEVTEVEDGEPVKVTMSWNTDGPRPDPNQSWNHIPQIRILRPYLRKEGGGYVSSENTNLFPEITLLANDAPNTTSKSYFARLIKDQIDFGMVRNWLAMCHAGHGDFCNQSKMLDHEIKDPATEIPSFRLIDVVDDCVIPAPHNCKYVGLSYVWGGIDISTILRLLNANISELEKPGSLKREGYYKKIPVTIRDAMQVVRELGLRYLWTDSLCIIQDDDKQNGSKIDAISKMDLVYGAAYITIIAASGADADAGLPGLHPGTRGITQPIEEIGHGFRLAFKPRAGDALSNCVHGTRAWTFQENQFSKRKLTFVGGQVIFSCRKAHEWREDQVFEDRHSKNHGVIESRDKEPNDIGEFEGLIQNYSGLSLKFHTDIYNAFAGMTRYFRTEMHANLCHGIPDKYFDWFLLWGPLNPQTRRLDTPSWSWSGWSGSTFPRIWDWYSRSMIKIQAAQRKRTWIIWYQRKAHDSKECFRIWTPKADPTSPSRGPRNFYGSHVQDRFPFNCTQTEPTPRLLTGAPTYITDSYNPNPGSGFLQFWTVSTTFKLAQANSADTELKPKSGYTRLGIFGSNNQELGIIFVHPDWCKNNVPKVHEFILICEGRDKRAKDGRIDDEPGWRYMVMLIEWHGDWAERVAVGWIKKRYLKKGLGNGPEWKEIILG